VRKLIGKRYEKEVNKRRLKYLNAEDKELYTNAISKVRGLNQEEIQAMRDLHAFIESM